MLRKKAVADLGSTESVLLARALRVEEPGRGMGRRRVSTVATVSRRASKRRKKARSEGS